MTKFRDVFNPIIIALIILGLVLVYAPVPVRAMGGAGTQANPFVIYSLTDLQDMIYDLDAYYILGNDIDATPTWGWVGTVTGEGFLPVGNLTTRFTGNFDGKNYKIKNLYSYGHGNYGGLFGYVGDGSTPVAITNVTLVSTNVSGNNYVGSLIGLIGNGGVTVANVAATNVSVTGIDQVGGLIGQFYMGTNDTLSNSHTQGYVRGWADTDNLGGLVGILYVNNRVTSVYANTSIIANTTANAYVGGLFGSIETNGNATISSSYALGTITNGDIEVGGFAGGIYGAAGKTVTFSSDYSDVDITSDVRATRVGGFVGDVGSGATGTLNFTSSYVTGDVTVPPDGGTGLGGGYVGGFVGNITNNGNFTSCYVTGKVNAEGVSGEGEYVGGFVGYSGGSPVITKSYVTGEVIGGETDVGGFAGFYSGTISQSYSTGKVTATTSGTPIYAGGFVGEIASGDTITDAYARGSVNSPAADTYMGGFIGWNTGTVTNAYSTGVVNSTSAFRGGFAAYNAGIVNTSFWDVATSNMTTSAGGYDRTTAQMKTQSTFTDYSWDFTNIWAISGAYNDGYPFFGFGGFGGGSTPSTTYVMPGGTDSGAPSTVINTPPAPPSTSTSEPVNMPFYDAIKQGADGYGVSTRTMYGILMILTAIIMAFAVAVATGSLTAGGIMFSVLMMAAAATGTPPIWIGVAGLMTLLLTVYAMRWT